MGLVILSDTDHEFLDSFEKVLQNEPEMEIARIEGPSSAADAALEQDAFVVVYGPSAGQDASFAAAERVAATVGQNTANLLISRTVDTALLRAAMRSGFHDAVAIEGAKYGDLATVVKEAYEVVASSRTALGATPETK